MGKRGRLIVVELFFIFPGPYFMAPRPRPHAIALIPRWMMGIGAFPWALWASDKLATKKEEFARDLVEVDFEQAYMHGTLHASHCSVKAP